MADLNAILDMTPGETPDPVSLTPGVYEFTITRYKTEEVGENKTGKLTWSIRADAIVESDLSDEDLELAKPLYMEFWLTEKSFSYDVPHISVKHFLTDALGIDEEDVSYRDLFELALGKTFTGKVEIEMQGKDRDRPTPTVKRVLVN